jgi:hypothetical protein
MVFRAARVSGTAPTIDDGSRMPSMSFAEVPTCSLFIPIQRPIAQHLSQPESLRLSPIEERLDNVRRQTGQRQKPADVGVRDALLLRKVGDRLRLTALDLTPPPVRAEEGLG